METEALSLDAYPFRRSYSTSKDDLLNDFYVPALEHSQRYDRAAGFFSSGLVALAPIALSPTPNPTLKNDHHNAISRL